MDKKTFEGLLSTQIETVNTAASEKEFNESILKTVHLLMKQVSFNSNVLSQYDQSEMRRFFASMGIVAQVSCDFFNAAKPHLDLVALSGAIGRMIDEKTEEISNTNVLIEDDRLNNAELLKREDELAQKKAEHSDLLVKIKVLEDASINYSDEKVLELRLQAEELSSNVEKNKEELSRLDKIVSNNKSLIASLGASCVRLSENRKEIEENIIELINLRRIEVERIYSDNSTDLENITSEIENYKKLYTKLEENINAVEEIRKIYAKNFEVNSDIIRGFEEYNISSAEDLPDEIRRIESTIKTELEKFNTLLGDVISRKEKIKNELQKTQGRQ